MSTFLINIIAKSNLAEVLALDDAALTTNSALLAENSNALRANSLASGTGTKSRKAARNELINPSFFSKVKQATRAFIGLDNAQNTVGYNFMGFSIRLTALVLPALLAVATALLPIIVSLLAMASAAILAGGALAGVLALGALLQMRQNKQANQGYGGARRPYESSSVGSISTMFEPIWKVLEDPKLKTQMDNVKWFFTATIGAFAEGLGNMIRGIDPGMLKKLETMFLQWLPKGMAQFTKWGNSMMRLIGAGTITRLGNLIDWIARGLMNAAIWLESGGGWQQIDKLTALLSDVCSVLMDMGTTVLPLLTDALSRIWPNPLKPMLETTTDLFNVLGNKQVSDTIVFMMKFLIIMLALQAVLFVVAAVLVSTPALIFLIITMLYFLFSIFKTELTKLLMIFLSLIGYVLTKIGEMIVSLVRMIPGHGSDFEDDLKKMQAYNLKTALEGGYAPDWTKQMYLDEAMQGNWGDRAGDIRNRIEIAFSSKNSNIEDVIVNGVNEKTGSFNNPNTNLRPRNTVRL